MQERSMANAIVTVHGAASIATVLGQGPVRIPTAGKIRAGIKVLTRAAAEHPRARDIYERGVAAGESFDRIERALVEALPELRHPLVPRNVPWFTVRPQDFGDPALARQLVDAYGEDRGEGRHLYRATVSATHRYRSMRAACAISHLAARVRSAGSRAGCTDRSATLTCSATKRSTARATLILRRNR
jgi:hypothetical protein